MKKLKQYLKESETYGIWDSEPTDRTEMGESCEKIKESSSFSKSKIIPLDKVKSFMDKARDKYDVDSHMEGNELIHAFYKKGTSNHVGTFINSNRVYFYDDADKIAESVLSEATMSDIPHEIDDQIHKLKDMRFDLEETQKNWELAGLDTTPLSNVITGINELIHSMYNNGAKLADQEVVNESTGHDKEWEIWTLYRRYEDEVNNKWEKELFSFDTKEEAEKFAKGSRFAGHHVQVVHKGDKPKKLKELKEAERLSIGIGFKNISGKIDWDLGKDDVRLCMKGVGANYYAYDNEALKAKNAGGAEWSKWVDTKWESIKDKLFSLADKFDNDVLKIMTQSGFKKKL